MKVLLGKCKCGVYITVNEHRDYYLTASQWFDEHEMEECDVKTRMIELDTVISIQFYPHTPVGSYTVHHYDLDAALDDALACITH